MRDIHPDLQRTARGNQAIGVICAALGGLCLVAVVTLSIPGAMQALGLATWTGDAAVSWGWFFFIISLVLALAVWAFLIVSLRWYRRATWVLANVAPATMQCALHVKQNRDSREITADLTSPADSTAPPALTGLGMLWPPWEVNALEADGAVTVYCDPQPDGPVIISTPHGLLWPYPRFKATSK